MPLVRIDLNKSYSSDISKKIADLFLDDYNNIIDKQNQIT